MSGFCRKIGKILQQGGMDSQCRLPLSSSVTQQKKWADGNPLSVRQNVLMGIIQKTLPDAATNRVIQARIPNYDALLALKGDKKPKLVRKKLERLFYDLKVDGEIIEDVDCNRLVKDDGEIDRDYYNELLRTSEVRGVSNRVYGDPALACTVLKPEDELKLRPLIVGAAQIAEKSADSLQMLRKVFGSKFATSCVNYVAIYQKLYRIQDKVNTIFTTDYNGDDEEIGAAGYAMYDKTIHLAKSICEGGSKEGRITMLHECAHLVNSGITDRGYNDSPGFYTMKEDDKLGNAAHYEVVPGWLLKMPEYPVRDFIPMNPVTAPVTKFDQGKEKADDYFRNAWCTGLNYVSVLRDYYLNPSLIKGKESELNSISVILGLTIHKNPDAHVTMLDITLMEAITKTLSLLMGLVSGVKDTDIPRVTTEDEYFQETVSYCVGIAASSRADVTIYMINKLQSCEL